jgi:hypothetical protein
MKGFHPTYTIISASEEPRSLLRSSSKEKDIMGAVAPKPAFSTHPHSKLLGFLAFSHDSSLFQHSYILTLPMSQVEIQSNIDLFKMVEQRRNLKYLSPTCLLVFSY